MNMFEMVRPDDEILVTGANGFIGTKVVKALVEGGFTNVRCLVRRSSRLDRLEPFLSGSGRGPRAHLAHGDVTSREDCANAVRGVSVVFHLAAGFDKSFAGAFMNSALGTRNLIEAFLERGRPKRFVNVSSFAVYSTLSLRRGGLLDENCPLEDAPQARHDAYGFGKLKQEELVRSYGAERGLRFAILRPGAVFGPGKKDLSGRIGIDTFGRFVNIGGSNVVPLTYVDNCADAIVLAGLRPGIDGETFNVVDDDLPTSRQFLKAYKRRIRGFSYLWVPYPVAYALSHAWESYATRSKGQIPGAFNVRRCTAEWKPVRYSNQKIRNRLGWNPRVTMPDAIERYLAQFEFGSAN